MNFPFSPYDFFGYLVAGFVVLCAAEKAADADWFMHHDLKWSEAAFWVAAAYIIGHIVSNIASFFIEHKFSRGVLGPSEDLLFKDEPATLPPATQQQPVVPQQPQLRGLRWWVSWVWPPDSFWYKRLFPRGLARVLFPIYFRPLSKGTQARVLQKSTPEGFGKPGRDLFNHCHAIVKTDKTTYARMTSFLNLYGFCRNVCMAALIAVPIMLYGAFRDVNFRSGHVADAIHYDDLWWMLVALGVAVGMLYRYLKFYRHYTLEVFMSYAELKKDKPKEDPKTA